MHDSLPFIRAYQEVYDASPRPIVRGGLIDDVAQDSYVIAPPALPLTVPIYMAPDLEAKWRTVCRLKPDVQVNISVEWHDGWINPMVDQLELRRKIEALWRSLTGQATYLKHLARGRRPKGAPRHRGGR